MTHHIAVIGDGAPMRDALRRSGFADVIVLRGVTDRWYDDAAHVWHLRDGDGAEHLARIVVDEHPPTYTLPPYLGVAVHGMPNHFLLSGPDRAGQARYIAQCVQTMDRRGSARIEVRYSTQRVYNDSPRSDRGVVPWRRLARKIPSAFHLSSHPSLDDEVFDGTVAARAGSEGGADERIVRARLTGHLDPIDGRYHWQGTVFDELPGASTVLLTVGDRSAEGRVTERSPAGTCSVRGVGAPPFPLDDVEVAVPQR